MTRPQPVQGLTHTSCPDWISGHGDSQIEPWNNLWADLSQGMANSQMEPWNNLWADLRQGMANSQIEAEVSM